MGRSAASDACSATGYGHRVVNASVSGETSRRRARAPAGAARAAPPRRRRHRARRQRRTARPAARMTSGANLDRHDRTRAGGAGARAAARHAHSAELRADLYGRSSTPAVRRARRSAHGSRSCRSCSKASRSTRALMQDDGIHPTRAGASRASSRSRLAEPRAAAGCAAQASPTGPHAPVEDDHQDSRWRRSGSQSYPPGVPAEIDVERVSRRCKRRDRGRARALRARCPRTRTWARTLELRARSSG